MDSGPGLWCAFAAALCAVPGDLRRHEIPDGLSIALGVVAVGLGVFGYGGLCWTDRLLGLLVGFAIPALLFHLGGLGGGDVKLLAAAGLAVGLVELGTALFWTALAGAVCGLLAARRGAREVAYAPAICAGFGITLLARHWPALDLFA